MVRHLIPLDLSSALTYLGEGTFQIMAGGTDLMIQKRSTAGTLPHFERDVLYIANLPELRYIKKAKGSIKIGSMTTLEEVLDHKLTPPLLKSVISEMASPAIRHAATIAGNIGNASPAGDSLVALYLLDAKVSLSSLDGDRVIPIDELIIGVRKTIIQPTELIREIIIPDDKYDVTKWVKVGGRQADAISKVSFAGAYRIDHGIVKDIRLAFGAVAPSVIRIPDIEDQMRNHTIKEVLASIPSILEKYSSYITPIDDQRSSKEYRKQVALNLAKNFIENIKEKEEK